MIIDEKPPLSGVYLAHFGVRGMKWGHRKTNLKAAISSRIPTKEQRTKAKRITIAGSVAVGSILYATGTLKPSASFVGGYAVKGAAFVGNAVLNGAITAIGTPYHIIESHI